ncbi:MAG TPA: tripartite tricarboxylate transporter substrate binding protein [Burkholderiales bacterium]|nr:tripartite tricarboxylate transporter substrate binding protein [Burkholderiales bacterium]
MSYLRITLLGSGTAVVLASAAFGAGAQSSASYPNRPLRFVVPYAAGGNGDIVSRIIAQKLIAQIGQQIVIDNRGGAGGNIGAELAARAAPDGYTIMLGTNTHVINMSLFAKLGYDIQRDFAPITLATSAPMVLIIHPALPAKTVKEFIALAKANPNKLNYATGGSGSSAHVISELFASMAGVQLTHVAYKGVAQATTDLIAGQIQMSFNSTSTALAHMQAGRVRALAISTATRSSIAPGLPTIAESGLPGFDASIWQGVFAPARTPPEMIARLNHEIVTALGASDVREQLRVQGLDTLPSTPEQFAAFIKVEIAKWAKVIRISGARAE